MTWRYHLDNLAHTLYAPTGPGGRAHRLRWHHHIHLIPKWLMAAICDWYENHLTEWDFDAMMRRNGGGVTGPPPGMLACPGGHMDIGGTSVTWAKCWCGQVMQQAGASR